MNDNQKEIAKKLFQDHQKQKLKGLIIGWFLFFVFFIISSSLLYIFKK